MIVLLLLFFDLISRPLNCAKRQNLSRKETYMKHTFNQGYSNVMLTYKQSLLNFFLLSIFICVYTLTFIHFWGSIFFLGGENLNCAISYLANLIMPGSFRDKGHTSEILIWQIILIKERQFKVYSS